MLKRQHRTADEGLAKLISKIACTIRSLNQYLLRCLIKPMTRMLSMTIAGHVDSSSCDWPRTRSTTHTVANLTSRTCCSTIEWLHCGWEVMSFSLQRDDRLDVFRLEIVAGAMVLWCKLLYNRTLSKCHIILISRDNLIRILLRCLLNHLEQTALFLLAIDDESATEYLVAAMLGVNLCKAEHLRVSKLTSQLAFHLVQVFNLLWTQCQTLLLIVFLQIVDMLDGSRLYVDSKNLLVQFLIPALQHRVDVGILVDGEELLDTLNTRQAHVLCNLHSIGTPRSDHLTSRTCKQSTNRLLVALLCATEKPLKCIRLLRRDVMIHTYCDDAVLWRNEKVNHCFLLISLNYVSVTILCKAFNNSTISSHFTLHTSLFISVAKLQKLF